MLLEVTDLLGRSYGLQEVRGDSAGAVALLRDEFAAGSPELRQTAAKELERMTAVLAIRGEGACHITRVCRNLLRAGLAPEG